MVFAIDLHRRSFVVTDIADPVLATRAEGAAGRRIEHARQVAFEDDPPLLDLWIGDGYGR